MHVLLATLGSYGDVYPFVGIGADLKRRGHQVTLLTNAHFEGLALQQGLDFEALGTEADYRRFADHPDLFDPRRGFQVFMETLALPNIAEAYVRLRTLTHGADDVVVLTSITVLGARVLRDVEPVPTLSVATMPMAIKSAYDVPRVGGYPLPAWTPQPLCKAFWWLADRLVIDRLIGPELNAFRASLGIVPVRHILSRWIHSPDGVLALFPAWFAPRRPDWPPNAHHVGFPLFEAGVDQALDPEVQAFLDGGSPPVAVMPGSLMQSAHDIFDAALAACETLDRRAIFLTRYPQQLPQTLPDTIRHFEYVPFGALLPHVAALVHHGGIGTCARAMAAGVPQLIHPMAYDQYDNAARAASLGVAETLPPKAFTPSAVVEKLGGLLSSPQVAARCEEVAALFEDADPANRICAVLEELQASRAPRASGG